MRAPMPGNDQCSHSTIINSIILLSHTALVVHCRASGVRLDAIQSDHSSCSPHYHGSTHCNAFLALAPGTSLARHITGTAPIFQVPLLLICCALHHRRHCVGFVRCLKNDFPTVVLVLVLRVRNRNRAGSKLGSLELAGETWETPQQSSFIFLPSNRLPALPHFLRSTTKYPYMGDFTKEF